MSNEPIVKRWTAKRKAAVVMDIFKGKTTVVEVARQYDLTGSEVKVGSTRPSAIWKTDSGLAPRISASSMNLN